jgi:TPR repeat protein
MAVGYYQKSTDGDAHYKAGLLFNSGGKGLEADPREAVRAFRKAIELGGPLCKVNAAFELGKLLSNGGGIPESLAEACEQFRTVADSKVEKLDADKKNRAAYQVGLWYCEGREELPKNRSLAFDYLGRASCAGYEPAHKPYSEVIFEIAEERADNKKAEVLGNYRIAAEHGHGMAAFRLGELYRKGAPGIDQNTGLAQKYLKIAVKKGIEGAEKAYNATVSFCIIM